MADPEYYMGRAMRGKSGGEDRERGKWPFFIPPDGIAPGENSDSHAKEAPGQ